MRAPTGYLIRFLIVLALCLLAGGASALSWCRDPGGGATDNFGAHEDSYALVNQLNNKGWAGRDEVALRGRFSFKYTVCGTRYVNRATRAKKRPEDSTAPNPRTTDAEQAGEHAELFLSYTGEFDFYAGTRPSGPVINRLNNPAINLRIPLRRLYGPGKSVDDNITISLEHRSNGQTTEAGTDLGTERAERAYNARDRAYFDTLSRGANFIGLAVKTNDPLGVSTNLDLGLKLRLYLDQDSDVRWGPYLGQRRTIKDYDLLQTTAAWQTPGGWVDVSWRVGAAGVKASSLTLGYQIPVRNFPLYVRYHLGRMNTLSNYTQRQDSIGIGLRFARPFQ